MQGKGYAARPNRTDAGIVKICDLFSFSPTESEKEQHKGDDITPALLRIIKPLLKRRLKVAILARANWVPWYVNCRVLARDGVIGLTDYLLHIRNYLPDDDRESVTISTVHQYKGLESSAIVVLDAIARRYPLIHPNWVFNRVFGDTVDGVEAEERRLFYVAATRAKDCLILLTDSLQSSPYVDELQRRTGIPTMDWARLSPLPSHTAPRVEVRVANSYAVKEQLRAQQYTYDGSMKLWKRSFVASNFSADSLRDQPWAKGGVKVEVYDDSGRLLESWIAV